MTAQATPRKNAPGVSADIPGELSLVERRNRDRRRRYAARDVLRGETQLPRVRRCGVTAAPHRDDDGKPIPVASPEGHYVDLKATTVLGPAPEGGIGPRPVASRHAGMTGVQQCGSTWACPVCAEKIQRHRSREIREALETATERGWVIGFLTFTVSHRRRDDLAEVWDAIAVAWRAMTGGAGPAWARDRDRYGIEGYVRLTETTVGANGWHVHVHALVFLNPAGRLTRRQVRVVNLVKDLKPRKVLVAEEVDFQTGELVPVYETRMVNVARPTRLVVAGTKHVPSAAAEENYRRDLEARQVGALDADGLPVRPIAPAVRGLYLRDVEGLGEAMRRRWDRAFSHDHGPTGTGRCRHDGLCRFRPSRAHGVDVRIIRDVSGLPDYFTKSGRASDHAKTAGSTANDVTSSHAKQARRGNRTPFALLDTLVRADAGEDVDPDVVKRDRALWREWERESRGRRQLVWSDGLRDLLGLGEETDDEDVVNGDLVLAGETVGRLSFPAYLALCRAGGVADLLACVETGDQLALKRYLHALEHAGQTRRRPPVDLVRPAA